MICNVCKLDKEETEFHWRNKAGGIRWKRCRVCKSEIDKKSYRENNRQRKQQIIANQKRLRKRNKDFVYKYRLNHPCVDCGESDPIVLEFDHLRDKEALVCELAHAAASITRIQKEIDKCEVRCANCHRRITHIRRLSSAR